MPEKFEATLVVNIVEWYQITNFTATPTMLASIVALPDIGLNETCPTSSLIFILAGRCRDANRLLHSWLELLSLEQIVISYDRH